MSADLCFTTDAFYFLLFYSPSNLAPSWLNGTQPYPITWSVVRVIWKCISEIWGIPSPYKLGHKTTFLTISQHYLRVNLTAYIFGMKYDVHNLVSALTTTRGLLHRAKRHELWSTNGFKLDHNFTHPMKILLSTLLPGFADGHQQTKLNQTLPDGER